MNEKSTANIVTKKSQLKNNFHTGHNIVTKSTYKIFKSPYERVSQNIKSSYLRPANNNLTIYTGRKSS